MFKMYELITKITSMYSHRGINVAYNEPEDNKLFLIIYANNRLKEEI